MLPEEESHHAIASLRAKPGQEVILFDGAGREAAGRIARIDRRQLHLEVTTITRHPFELPHKITLAVAMTKAHRQGYLIEKCTELGVAAIWPIIAERSVAKPGSPAVMRWSRRAIEAARQSQRFWVPRIEMAQAFSTALARAGEFEASVLMHTETSVTTFSAFISAQPVGTSLLVWVGPEGGWSKVERDGAIGAGAVPATLAPTVLRTETAAVAVCAAAAMYGARPSQDPKDM